jgi:hypothetical protein
VRERLEGASGRLCEAVFERDSGPPLLAMTKLLRGAGVALPRGKERTAQVVLGRRPVERHALAGALLQRSPIRARQADRRRARAGK